MSLDESATDNLQKHDETTTTIDNTYSYVTPPNRTHAPPDNTPLLEQISQLLEKKFDENNKKMATYISNTIDTKLGIVTNTLRQDLTTYVNKVSKEQSTIKTDITTLNEKMCKLENENKKLKEELGQIKSLINGSLQQQPIDNSHKIVLYGLGEPDYETERQLHQQIIHIFQNLMNVDLTGYIEELTRIGRKTATRRPIIIELLRKRMARYLLQNRRCFKNSGLIISEFLDDKALQQRRDLQKLLRAARLDGHDAIIRNNKIIIDGKVSTYLHNENTDCKTSGPPRPSTSSGPARKSTSSAATQNTGITTHDSYTYRDCLLNHTMRESTQYHPQNQSFRH